MLESISHFNPTIKSVGTCEVLSLCSQKIKSKIVRWFGPKYPIDPRYSTFCMATLMRLDLKFGLLNCLPLVHEGTIQTLKSLKWLRYLSHWWRLHHLCKGTHLCWVPELHFIEIFSFKIVWMRTTFWCLILNTLGDINQGKFSHSLQIKLWWMWALWTTASAFVEGMSSSYLFFWDAHVNNHDTQNLYFNKQAGRNYGTQPSWGKKWEVFEINSNIAWI